MSLVHEKRKTVLYLNYATRQEDYKFFKILRQYTEQASKNKAISYEWELQPNFEFDFMAVENMPWECVWDVLKVLVFFYFFFDLMSF